MGYSGIVVLFLSSGSWADVIVKHVVKVDIYWELGFHSTNRPLIPRSSKPRFTRIELALDWHESSLEMPFAQSPTRGVQRRRLKSHENEV